MRRLLLLAVLLTVPPGALAQNSLKVRTVTAFVPFDPATGQATLEEASEFLQQARQEFEAAGFEVQTLRLALPPLAETLPGVLVAERMDFFLRLDRWATEKGILLSLGPAIVSDSYEAERVRYVEELLLRSRSLSLSVIIADEEGPRPRAIRAAAEITRALGASPAPEPPAFRFAALADCPSGIPFFPAAYAAGHRKEFAIGLESAGVFARALQGEADLDRKKLRLRAALVEPLQRIESLARALGEESGWAYLGIDTSPAPNGEVSIAAAVENLSGEPLGSAGTLAAVAWLTDFIRTVPVQRTGFSGLMLPVLEDKLLAQRVAEGRLSVSLLLAYSAVSGTGLDVVPLPGDTGPEVLQRLLGDVAALAVKLDKPLTARLLLVAGKQAGDRTEFDSPFLTNTTILPVE